LQHKLHLVLPSPDSTGNQGMAMALASAPEQGQLVSVRSRNWIVNEVVPSTLPTSGLHGISDPQTLVSLASVEDDGLGEEIQVVWELEPGARLIEKVALPDPTGFDPPDQLNAFLDAVLWGASSSADVRNIQAPFRSGIDIEDYQLDPVVRAIQMPRVNLLVADALLIEAAKDHAARLARETRKWSGWCSHGEFRSGLMPPARQTYRERPHRTCPASHTSSSAASEFNLT
jgi:hypothetical protein